jgi:hypothetical protein
MQRRWKFVAGVLLVLALFANGLVAFAREIEPGDDRFGPRMSVSRQAAVGDDRGGVGEIQAGDDRGGAIMRLQPGDDRGGLQASTAVSMPQDDKGKDLSVSTSSLATNAVSESQPLDDKGGSGQSQPGDDRGGGGHGDDGGGHH